MCRLLLVHNKIGIYPRQHLNAFKEVSRKSKEFQGHGWGCAWLDENAQWKQYHNIEPVWESTEEFPKTTLFLAHSRSAFKDEGIIVENNMPFDDGHNVFVFNGELQGVKIKAEGRIGAEKIFNTLRRFYKGDYAEAVERGVMVIKKRTRYVRALNFFMANAKAVHVCSEFGEDPEYFQLQDITWQDTRIICSQTYSFGDNNWMPLDNHTIFTIPLI